MKAVMLAAGEGTRIRSVHGEHPKCLIEVDDSTILDHQLEGLSKAGIDEVVIVVGYQKEQIIDYVKAHSFTRKQLIEFVENPAHALGNNIYSLWLALDWVSGDNHRSECGRHLQFRHSREGDTFLCPDINDCGSFLAR